SRRVSDDEPDQLRVDQRSPTVPALGPQLVITDRADGGATAHRNRHSIERRRGRRRRRIRRDGEGRGGIVLRLIGDSGDADAGRAKTREQRDEEEEDGTHARTNILASSPHLATPRLVAI